MDWSKSYSATWRIFRVNRNTWADAAKLADVDEVSISRTADGELLESGSLKLSGDFEPDYYRIVMTAVQGDEVQRVDVATLLFMESGGDIDYGRTVHDVDGFSVLYPASKTVMVDGEYAPAGVDGAQYAADLLSATINAPVEVEGSFTLNEYIVHEIGSTVLEAVWAVLNAGNFVMQIDGRGEVHIVPKPTAPSLIIDNSNTRLLSNGVSFTADTSEIPNRYIVVEDNLITMATNSDPNSSVSTVSRGYNVDEVDTSPTPINGETLSAYADRKLHEMSIQKDERTYTREYAPDVNLYSVVKASIDGLEGNLRVESQSITCDNGIIVEEMASKEIELW